jgi:cyanophycinase
VLVGGSLESPSIYREIVRLAGGEGRAKIGVITAASSQARENGEHYKETFRRHGAADVQWIALGERPTGETLRQIRGLTGFFFGGGDQSRLLKTMLRHEGGDTPELAAIRRAMANGALVGGTSAGTAVQVSGPMITGGESYDALRRAPVDELSPRRGGRLSYHAGGGLGLFKWGALDTHFNERGRSGRLIRLADATRQKLAFGVDEDTALVVRDPLGHDPRMTVVGKGGVSIFDLTNARSGRDPSFWIKNVRTAYLTEGDTYRPRKRRMKRARDKRPFTAEDGAPSPGSRDIFSSPELHRRNSREFVRVTRDLFAVPRSTITTRVHENPEWQVTISKTRGARCYSAAGQRDPASYKNLRVDIRRSCSRR